MKTYLLDAAKLVKFRLSLSVALSSLLTFLVASELMTESGSIDRINWATGMVLLLGGFLTSAAASCFNELIEISSDKLMSRTKDRPLPSGRLRSGQGLVIGSLLASLGTWLLCSISIETGILAFVSLALYVTVYTPLKSFGAIAVVAGAIPGSLPQLIGYFAAVSVRPVSQPIDLSPALVLFLIQFIWQFPHFWSIAWFSDQDYAKAGFHLLPTKRKDKLGAMTILLASLTLAATGLLPAFLGFGGLFSIFTALVTGATLAWFALKLSMSTSNTDAKRLMFASLTYIPLLQLSLILDSL